MSDNSTFQVGRLTGFTPDDPEFADENAALAHAKSLAVQDWREVIGIWTGPAHGSEPLYGVHDGSVFKRV